MSVKDPIYYSDGRLQGSNLSDQDCYRLETLRRLYENGEGIPEFKHLLYDLDETQVEIILDTQEVPQGMDMARGTLLDVFWVIRVAWVKLLKFLLSLTWLAPSIRKRVSLFDFCF